MTSIYRFTGVSIVKMIGINYNLGMSCTWGDRNRKSNGSDFRCSLKNGKSNGLLIRRSWVQVPTISCAVVLKGCSTLLTAFSDRTMCRLWRFYTPGRLFSFLFWPVLAVLAAFDTLAYQIRHTYVVRAAFWPACPESLLEPVACPRCPRSASFGVLPNAATGHFY